MNQTPSGPSILRFGVFELNLKGGELRRSGVLIKLQRQPFKLLSLLATHSGQLRLVTETNASRSKSRCVP